MKLEAKGLGVSQHESSNTEGNQEDSMSSFVLVGFWMFLMVFADPSLLGGLLWRMQPATAPLRDKTILVVDVSI